MVVQIDSFPQYSPKMQLVCCKAIVKVFLALAEKGPVHWNFISTVGKLAIFILTVVNAERLNMLVDIFIENLVS